ncbi:MAG: ThiF family adenylyltransferase [Alphaproteobacteria bacterium]
MGLSDTQIERYARHLVLKEIGGPGQHKLLAARVLVIGAGGLGSPLILYLAAAGVGTIGVIDDDTVSLSNLQRQVLHDTDRVGSAKTQSARDAVARINPDVMLIPHTERLTADNALDLFAQYDLIADGSDTFSTRLLVNDAAFLARRPLVSAAVARFDGQLATYKAFERPGGRRIYPCYRCFVPRAPDNPDTDMCSEVGILGAVAGAMGTLQAIEVIKELLGIGDGLAGRLLIQDFLSTTSRMVRLPPDPACPLCGEAPTITSLAPLPNTMPGDGQEV